MCRLAVCSVVLAACRLGFDRGEGPVGDGGIRDGEVEDAARDARRDGDDDDDDAPGDAGACPQSYVVLPAAGTSSRYRAVDDSQTWQAAEAACEADGHHLAIPDAASERTALYQALLTENIWVGVTDRVVEGTWMTVIGTPATYVPWAPGEPDAEDCVYISSATSLFVAQDCGSGRRYICECDGAAASPTSY